MNMPGPQLHPVRLTFEGANAVEIACAENEDIVSAAMRHGILLVSECRQGSCGACRGFLEEGKYDALLEHSEHALSEYDEDEGWILACRLKPRSALVVDFDYPADRAARLDIDSRPGRIIALDRVSPTTVRLVIRTLVAQDPLQWKAGQYVRLHLTQAGLTRPFSVANLSSTTRELEFFIRLVPGGRFSKALTQMRGEGEAVSVEGPYGNFELAAQCAEPVFVAGGTGLVPVLAMLRQLVIDTPDSRPTLIFGAANEQELIALDEIETLRACCSALKVEIAVVSPGTTWAGVSGTAVDALKKHLACMPNPQRSHFYLCGPAAMVAAGRGVISTFRVPEERVHHESFTINGDPP